MKTKKLVLLLTTFTTTTALMATSIFLCNKQSKAVIGSDNNVSDAVLTFDAENRTVTTQHGNTLTTQPTGAMKSVSGYLCGISGTNGYGYFYINESIQIISKIQVTWKARCTHEMIFKIGTTKGGSNVWSSGNIVGLMQNYTERTSTYTISNSGEANYFSIYATGMDSTCYYYFKKVVITYSCSYN